MALAAGLEVSLSVEREKWKELVWIISIGAPSFHGKLLYDSTDTHSASSWRSLCDNCDGS